VLSAADRAFRAACKAPSNTVTAFCTGNEMNCRITIRQQNQAARSNQRPGWGKDKNYKFPKRHRMTALATTAFGPHDPTTLIKTRPNPRWICGVCLGTTVPVRRVVAYIVSVNVEDKCDGCKVFLKTESHRQESALVSVI
jgi:hypothetical protein